MFEPFASSLIAEGAGHVWYAAATRPDLLHDVLHPARMLRDHREDLRDGAGDPPHAATLAPADAAPIADAIADFFPDFPPPLLTTACARYKSLGIWSTTPVLPRQGYDRLLSSLVSGGFVPLGTSFDKVAVDNTLAEQVLAENPPLLD